MKIKRVQQMDARTGGDGFITGTSPFNMSYTSNDDDGPYLRREITATTQYLYYAKLLNEWSLCTNGGAYVNTWTSPAGMSRANIRAEGGFYFHVETYSGSDYPNLFHFYTNSSNEAEYQVAIVPSVGVPIATDSFKPNSRNVAATLDCFYLGSSYYMFMDCAGYASFSSFQYHTGPVSDTYKDEVALSTATINSNTLTKCSRGYVYEGKYYFMGQTGGVTYLYSFDGTSITQESTLFASDSSDWAGVNSWLFGRGKHLWIKKGTLLYAIPDITDIELNSITYSDYVFPIFTFGSADPIRTLKYLVIDGYVYETGNGGGLILRKNIDTEIRGGYEHFFEGETDTDTEDVWLFELEDITDTVDEEQTSVLNDGNTFSFAVSSQDTFEIETGVYSEIFDDEIHDSDTFDDLSQWTLSVTAPDTLTAVDNTFELYDEYGGADCYATIPLSLPDYDTEHIFKFNLTWDGVNGGTSGDQVRFVIGSIYVGFYFNAANDKIGTDCNGETQLYTPDGALISGDNAIEIHISEISKTISVYINGNLINCVNALPADWTATTFKYTTRLSAAGSIITAYISNYQYIQSEKVLDGYVSSYANDDTLKEYELTSGIKKDLDKEITFTDAGTSVEKINAIIEDECNFIHGTLGAVAGDWSYTATDSTIRSIFKDIQNYEKKVLIFDRDGSPSFTAVASLADSGIVATTANIMKIVEIKEDVPISKVVLYGDEITSTKVANVIVSESVFEDRYPFISDQGQLDTIAENILAMRNGQSSILTIELKLTEYADIGKYITVTYARFDITAQTYFIQHFRKIKDEGKIVLGLVDAWIFINEEVAKESVPIVNERITALELAAGIYTDADAVDAVEAAGLTMANDIDMAGSFITDGTNSALTIDKSVVITDAWDIVGDGTINSIIAYGDALDVATFSFPGDMADVKFSLFEDDSGNIQLVSVSGDLEFSSSAGSVVFKSPIDCGTEILTNVGAPVAATDAARLDTVTVAISSHAGDDDAHHALVSIGDARGLSLAGQALSMAAASTSTVGTVQLSDSVVTDDSTKAATSTAVKAVQDALHNPVTVSSGNNPLTLTDQLLTLLNSAGSPVTLLDASPLSNLDTSVPTSKAVTTAISAITPGIANVVDDTTPQLGGPLDAQQEAITDVGYLNVDADGDFKVPSTILGSKYSVEPWVAGNNLTDYTGWTDDGNDTENVVIVAEIGGHTNVINSVDSATASKYQATYYEFTLKATGACSVWVRTDDITKRGYVVLREGASDGGYVYFDVNIFDSNTVDTGFALTNDTWYHVAIEWDCTGATDVYKLYVNQNFIHTWNESGRSGINRFRIGTASGDVSYNYYWNAPLIVDTIEEAWDNIADGLVRCKGLVAPVIHTSQIRGELDKLYFEEQASDPADPASGQSVMWVDSNGDLHVKLNHGGTTKDVTLIDWSAA